MGMNGGDMVTGGVVLDPAGPAGDGSYRERTPGDAGLEGMTVADVAPGVMSRLLDDADSGRLPDGGGLRRPMPGMDAAGMVSRALGDADRAVVARMPADRALAMARYVADVARGPVDGVHAGAVASILTDMPHLTVRMAAVMGEALCDGDAGDVSGVVRALRGACGGDPDAMAEGMGALTRLWARGGDPMRRDARTRHDPFRSRLDVSAAGAGMGRALSRLAAAMTVAPGPGHWRTAGLLCRMACGGGAPVPGSWACSIPGVPEGDDPGVRRALMVLSCCSAAVSRDGPDGDPSRLGRIAGLGVSAAGMPSGFMGECLAAEGFDPSLAGMMLSVPGPVMGSAVSPSGGDGGWMASFRGFLGGRGLGLCMPVSGSWLPRGMDALVRMFNVSVAHGPAITVTPAPAPQGYLRG